MRRLLVPAVLLAALAGCGGAQQDTAEDFEGEQRVVAVAVEDLEDAGSEGDAQAICEDLLADELVARLRQAGSSCPRAVDEALEDADDFALAVEAVRVRGDAATVRVTSGSGNDEETDTLRLVKDGRQWKIASLGEGGAGT